MMSRLLTTLVATVFVFLTAPTAHAAGPYQATGFKVGEVSPRSAIVWTRLTTNQTPNPADAPMVDFVYEEGRGRQPLLEIVWPDGGGVASIRNAVPGSPGEVRVLYRPVGTEQWWSSGWELVDPASDFTRQFELIKLEPGTPYAVQVESRTAADGEAGETLVGGFVTAPRPRDPARVVFTVSTGQMFDDRDGEHGFDIYSGMLKLEPSFFVHTGDIVYYDKLAKTPDLAHYHWQRTYSLPSNVTFHRLVGSYFEKDDHDTLVDDCWPTMDSPYMGEMTFAKGVEIFKQQVPMKGRTYRTRRWGKDLQIWLVEGRDYRSPNPTEDGPAKTIWGEQQKQWFKRTLADSDATFKVLISPTPIVGPDRGNKRDNHSNANFTHEGDELRAFIASQKNLVVVCGDRHWQYMSVHPDTGVREYSCGPASNKHAGGWQQSDFREDYHKYLNVTGGFLSATVERTDEVPMLTFRWHNPDGSVNFEDKLTPQQ
jgi:alkaline phosphatase D